MTPPLVFEQVPLNDIFYETANLPIEPVAFNLRSEDISRRELLLAIAEFWGLYMAFNSDDTGNPTAVIVEGPIPETPSLETQ